MRWDPRLNEVAQAQVDAAVRGRAAFSETQLRNRVFGLGYEALESHEIESASFRALAGLDLWPRRGERSVGYGIARTADGQRFILLIYLAK